LGDVNTGETIAISFPNGKPNVRRISSIKQNFIPVNAAVRLHLWQGDQWFYKAVQPISIPGSNESVDGICKFIPADSGPSNFSITVSYTVKQKALSGVA